MALLNLERRFLYLFEPHTGSRATREALETMPGSNLIGNHHAGLMDLCRKGYIQDDLKHKITVCCTVRNPFDTFITRWMRHPISRSPDMGLFIKTQRHANIVNSPAVGLWCEATRFIWFEHLEEDLRNIFGISLPPKDPTHKCKGKNRPWNEYFEESPPEYFDILLRKYSTYCKRFGYSYTWSREGKLVCEIDQSVRDAYNRGKGRIC